MNYKADDIYRECLKQYIGIDGESLGGISPEGIKKGSLADSIFSMFESIISGSAPHPHIPGGNSIKYFYDEIKCKFSDYYGEREDSDFFRMRAEVIMTSADPVERARAISELWAPELNLPDDEIYDSWKLGDVEANPRPYEADEIIIQLNSLYEPVGLSAPAGISAELAEEYEAYMKSEPKRIAVYDHPVPVFTDGESHELVKCLSELNEDIKFEKECGVLPSEGRLKVLISISTTHLGLDIVCEKWIKTLIDDMGLNHLDCYLLSENKARELDHLMGKSASVFTVEGKYACHFGALKYAQLIFERGCGIRAGFKLDTDEGIHSKDMKSVTGKTWFEQLAHPYWGGTALTADGRNIKLGFNIGEYVDSRDLDSLGYEKAIRTPEVKPGNDLRGSYLVFNKGAAQAKGTLLLNRAQELEDFVSHPLVKGGGYGVDNDTLRNAVPVGFSMVGRAEDQQFYFSTLNRDIQGIFNPRLRIIHYKASVAASEHRSKVGTTVADIYRMILFRELMRYLGVIDKTRPFPAVYASPLAGAQAFFLCMFLIYKSSAEGDESTAEEYLEEGLNELIPLLEAVESGDVITAYEAERAAWAKFATAADAMSEQDAGIWVDSLRI